MAVESTSTTSSEQGVASTLSSDEGQDSNTDTVVRKSQDDNVSVTVNCSKTNDDDTSNATTESLTMIQLSLQKVAAQLATSVDFFREHAPDIGDLRTIPYTRLPAYCNWNRDGNGKSSKDDDNESSASAAQGLLFGQRKRLVRDVTQFPLLPKKGKLQVPMALFCEAEDHPQRTLAIVNYWRQLNACRQRELKTSMQRFYVRPNVTNERLNLNFKSNLASVSVSVSSQPPTTTALTPSSASASASPPGVRTPSWGFRCLETCTQLAEILGLCPPNGENKNHACDLLRTANLEVPRTNCKVEDCVYPAMARNHGYCCRHGLHFGPTHGKVNGRRGYRLMGDVYTRPYLATTTTSSNNANTKTNPPSISGNNCNGLTTATTIKKLATCSCRNETCVGIGYSPTMIQFDVHRLPKDFRDAIWNNPETLNMTARTHFQTSRNTTNERNTTSTNDPSTRLSVLRLAPWHFHPEHREFLPDGSWKLVDHPSRPSPSSSEEANSPIPIPMAKEWKGLPLPTYSPNDFLEEPIMKEYSARKSIVASTTDMLPSWCRYYSKREEGPLSIAEIQRNALWERTIELEQELASRILSFRSKERALESNLEKLQSKYDEKKFLKRRDKKRKRKNNSNKKTSTVGSSKTLSPSAEQENNKSRSPKKKRSESMEKTVDGRKNTADEETTTNNSERHDSSSATIEEATHCRDSHQMGPVHYTNHPQQLQHHQNHRHHPYPHAYPQHLSQHHHAHPNRAAAMDHLRHHPPPPHYHHHSQQQQPLAQQQPQPTEGSYPQHHRAYHPRHDEREEDQYREHEQDPPQHQHPQHPQHHPHPQQQHQQQQQPQQQQQQQQHYPEQQDWQRGYYDD